MAVKLTTERVNSSKRVNTRRLATIESNPVLVQMVATGGNVITGGGFRTHIFTSSNTFTITNFPTAIKTANILVVAGGGGGGVSQTFYSGGGGAGGFLSEENFSFDSSEYTITIGAGATSESGGPAYSGAPANDLFGGRGSNTSVIGSGVKNFTAVGGGGGGSGTNADPSLKAGGSGGGGQYPGQGFNFPGPAEQGFPGGPGASGGGGGAGEYGQPGNPGPSRGGDGKISNISGTSNVYYAGGGAGLNNFSPSNNPNTGRGGLGGGGTSNPPFFPGPSVNGNVNTGGGGGAGWRGSGGGGPFAAGAGGSGIVIIRYPFT